MMYKKLFRAWRPGRGFLAVVVAVLLSLIFAPLVPAEENPAKQSDWEYAVKPYVWAVSLKGDLTVKGNTSDIDLKFSDVWDELNIGGMLEFEGRNPKQKWGFYGRAIYADLGKDKSAGRLVIDPSITITWLSLGGVYRIGTWDLSEEGGKAKPTVTVDTYMGLRYTAFDLEVTFEGLPIPKKEEEEEWVDPLFGLRTIWQLSERWRLLLSAGISGIAFGSDFGWDAFGVLGYQFSLFGNDNATVFVGYKALSQDYDDGEGTEKFEWDMTAHGPLTGLKITF